jgi:hypothetical protein
MYCTRALPESFILSAAGEIMVHRRKRNRPFGKGPDGEASRVGKKGAQARWSDPQAKQLASVYGRQGGEARAAKLSAKRRREIAIKANAARHAKRLARVQK